MKPHPPGAVASLVLGILALLAGFTPITLGVWALFAWFMPLFGLGFGIFAIVSARRATTALAAMPGDYTAGGIHTAGFVTGIVGLVLSLLVGLWGMMIIGILSALLSAASTGAPTPAGEPPLLW